MTPRERHIRDRLNVLLAGPRSPELAEATRRCIEATGAQISWDICEAGVDVMETEGTPLPQKTLDSDRLL